MDALRFCGCALYKSSFEKSLLRRRWAFLFDIHQKIFVTFGTISEKSTTILITRCRIKVAEKPRLNLSISLSEFYHG